MWRFDQGTGPPSSVRKPACISAASRFGVPQDNFHPGLKELLAGQFDIRINDESWDDKSHSMGRLYKTL